MMTVVFFLLQLQQEHLSKRSHFHLEADSWKTKKAAGSGLLSTTKGIIFKQLTNKTTAS